LELRDVGSKDVLPESPRTECRPLHQRISEVELAERLFFLKDSLPGNSRVGGRALSRIKDSTDDTDIIECFRFDADSIKTTITIPRPNRAGRLPCPIPPSSTS
jgi:hypothetical protein